MQNSFELSTFEQQLVQNADVMYAKNSIIKKVIALFGRVSDSYVSTAGILPQALQVIPPKIARGEQYLSLPYVMLDYPRIFLKEDIFAIRTFFWWGNSFSIHLHLAGQYQTAYKSKIISAINNNYLQNWYGCINQNQWQHHFDADNYVEIDAWQQASFLENSNFTKIAKKIPLNEWNDCEQIFVEQFSLLTSLLIS